MVGTCLGDRHLVQQASLETSLQRSTAGVCQQIWNEAQKLTPTRVHVRCRWNLAVVDISPFMFADTSDGFLAAVSPSDVQDGILAHLQSLENEF